MSRSADDRSRSVALVLAGMLLAGIAATLSGTMPSNWLVSYSERVGHAEDFTADRLFRFRLMAVGLGAMWALVALAGLTAGRQLVENAVAALNRERKEGRGERKDFRPVLGLSVVVCLVVGAGLRIGHLNQPIKYDEAYTYLHYARRPLYQGLVDFGAPNNHLLHTLFSHVVLRLLGDWEWTLRMPAFVAGLLAIGATYRLGKRAGMPTLTGTGQADGAGLLAAAMMAASAVQISYSANARGYTLVTWLGLVLAYRMSRAVRRGRAVDWLFASIAAVLGFFTIPTMLFCFVGAAGWALWQVASGRAQQPRGAGLVKLAVFTAVVGLVTLTLYAPALAFSGLEAFRHDVLRSYQMSQLPGRLAFAWWEAIGSWSEGIAPVWLLGPLAMVGCVVGIWGRVGIAHQLPASSVGGVHPWDTEGGARHAHASTGMAPGDGVGLWLAMFLATAVLTTLTRQAPPPRVFTFLAPYFYLFAATGLLVCVRGIGSMLPMHRQAIAPYAAPILMLLILVGGGVYVSSGRVFEHTETGGCPAARPTAAWLAEHASDADRVLAPLGCDVPILYYLVRGQVPIEWMGEPTAGETVYLLIPKEECPAKALDDPVVAPLVQGVEFGPWRQAKGFGTGSLWKAVAQVSCPDS